MVCLLARYTVEGGKKLMDTWSPAAADGSYELHLHGPDGFVRHFKGDPSTSNLAIRIVFHEAKQQIEFKAPSIPTIQAAFKFTVVDNAYGGCFTV